MAANPAVHEAGHPFARALYTCGQEASTSQTAGKTVPDSSEDKAKTLSLSPGKWGLAPSVSIAPIIVYPQG